MNDIHYETRYIAFLDILGFSDMVERSTKNQSILNNINKAINYIYEVRHDNYHGSLAQVELGKEVTTFSDSIVISYNASTPGGGFHVLIDLVFICIDLLSLGILVRGGVTVDPLIHNRKKCFGPAMNKAYKMESKDANYPRIIIDADVLEYDLKNPGSVNTVEWEYQYLMNLIHKDSNDKLLFLDYLKQQNEFDESDFYLEFLYNTRNFIMENLTKFKENEKSKRVYEKYKWLKQYYNETINTFDFKFGLKEELLI